MTTHAARSIHRVRSYLERPGVNLMEIARAARIPRSTLQSLKANGWVGNVDTLDRLERVIPPDWQAGDPAPDADPAPDPNLSNTRATPNNEAA